MGRLIEEISLRNKLHVFEDRTEAGGLIAGKLVRPFGRGGSFYHMKVLIRS
ncbi:MAG: hypothetical protein J5U17_12130 [Candidatus Methanoperedens sp.]|nr:hypothetical protein [Candidatus Methanoperedens sp.]MCE8428956.1 hypothetical protein [Candidatus Methanoperedens sp.]